MSCDPHFTNVGLLLHIDAPAPGPANRLIDSSSFATGNITGATASVLGPAAKFGAAGFDFSLGSSTSPVNEIRFNIISGDQNDCTGLDYTIEGWYKIYGAAGNNNVVLSLQSAANNLATLITFNASLGCLAGSIEGSNMATPAGSLVLNTYFSWAVSVVSGTAYIFANGILQSSFAISARANQWQQIFFGGSVFGSSMVGAGDEFRVTKGIGRYTSNYTPTGPFPDVQCVPATIPNVVGEVLATAQADIVAAGFVVGAITTAGSFTVPAGNVISQNPAGGSTALQGSSVDLVQSLGALSTVPDLTNTSAAVVAPGLLAAAHLVLGLIAYQTSGVIIAGNVISQSPAVGTVLTEFSAVNVIVSSGLPALRVPDIFGLSQADAQLAITRLGLVVGAISSAPSQLVPPGTVQAQNPSAGIPVAVGSVVSFVLSLGTPATGTMFDFEATVISQYANSPTILQLVQNLNQYIDQSTNFANFYNFVWNVDTAVGFGLNIWGKIVGVSRLLQIPNTTDYVGFDNGTRSPPDWENMGSDQPPQPAVGGAMYTGFNATTTYLLGDDAYRQLILAKAFANIAATTAPAINTILQNLYGKGTAWVLNTGPMAISYNLNFKPSAIQLAILQQSGVIPTPPGVSVTIVVPP